MIEPVKARRRRRTIVPLQDECQSPYLCAWCRNGLSMNEAHAGCLAEGRFSRFLPVAETTVDVVPRFPIAEVIGGQLPEAETSVVVFFYLWRITRALGDRHG